MKQFYMVTFYYHLPIINKTRQLYRLSLTIEQAEHYRLEIQRMFYDDGMRYTIGYTLEYMGMYNLQ